eukprot:14954421-Alexandrium_andersonii.AAC.1
MPVDVTSPSPEHSPAAGGAAGGTAPRAPSAEALNDPRMRSQALNRLGRELSSRRSGAEASLAPSQDFLPDWAGPEHSPVSAPPPASAQPPAAAAPAAALSESRGPPTAHQQQLPEETARPAGPIRLELVPPPEAAPRSSSPAAATVPST